MVWLQHGQYTGSEDGEVFSIFSGQNKLILILILILEEMKAQSFP
jgi:hypothetical protein